MHQISYLPSGFQRFSFSKFRIEYSLPKTMWVMCGGGGGWGPFCRHSRDSVEGGVGVCGVLHSSCFQKEKTTPEGFWSSRASRGKMRHWISESEVINGVRILTRFLFHFPNLTWEVIFLEFFFFRKSNSLPGEEFTPDMHGDPERPYLGAFTTFLYARTHLDQKLELFYSIIYLSPKTTFLRFFRAFC